MDFTSFISHEYFFKWNTKKYEVYIHFTKVETERGNDMTFQANVKIFKKYSDRVLVGILDMSNIRQSSNYKKWEQLNITELRVEAQNHQEEVCDVTFYKTNGNKLDSLLCIETL